MTMDVILGLVRHALTFGGGYLVTAGVTDAASVETAAGGVAALVGIIWSVLHKKAKAA